MTCLQPGDELTVIWDNEDFDATLVRHSGEGSMQKVHIHYDGYGAPPPPPHTHLAARQLGRRGGAAGGGGGSVGIAGHRALSR